MAENHIIESQWQHLPPSLLLTIFKKMSSRDILNAAQSCHSWNNVVQDDLLWRFILLRDFKIPTIMRLKPGAASWISEYRRLKNHVPMVLTEEKFEHTQQVLHISFSQNGKLFCTCAKDGLVIVWKATYPITIKFKFDMKKYKWKYAHYSKFIEDDTMISITSARICAGDDLGEVAIFSLTAKHEPNIKQYSLAPETPPDVDTRIQNVLVANCHSNRPKRAAKDISVDVQSCTNYEQVCGSGRLEAGPRTSKYLIFTRAARTFYPHQIGFKLIDRQMEECKSDVFTFDRVEHLFEMHGYINGMAISPDHRYVYLKCQAWPDDYVITNRLEPPPVAEHIDIHVIDMHTLERIAIMNKAHPSHTPNVAFFQMIDVCDQFITSCKEDMDAFIWDRYYTVCLAKYNHGSLVNCIVFNHTNSEMMVTTSDNFAIKVWRSIQQTKDLNATEIRRATKCRRRKK